MGFKQVYSPTWIHSAKPTPRVWQGAAHKAGPGPLLLYCKRATTLETLCRARKAGFPGVPSAASAGAPCCRPDSGLLARTHTLQVCTGSANAPTGFHFLGPAPRTSKTSARTLLLHLYRCFRGCFHSA